MVWLKKMAISKVVRPNNSETLRDKGLMVESCLGAFGNKGC